jgi:uncharacterized protein
LPDIARRWTKFARPVFLALLLVVLMAVLLSQVERYFIFFPTSAIIMTPENLGVQYEEVFFETQQGRRLHGWFVPGPSSSGVTWLWFHGNGGNISHRTDEIAQIHRRLGVNVFIFDYQGYGISDGRPSERGTYQDSRAALAYLHSRPDVDPQQIVYFGRSLGAAVAVELAVEHPPAGLVLVAPFASLGDMARIHYAALPVASWLAGNRYNSLERIPRTRVPLLILHGDRDTIVPISQGEKLYQAANQPKQFLALLQAGHDDTYIAGGDPYWNMLGQFLDRAASGAR